MSEQAKTSSSSDNDPTAGQAKTSSAVIGEYANRSEVYKHYDKVDGNDAVLACKYCGKQVRYVRKRKNGKGELQDFFNTTDLLLHLEGKPSQRKSACFNYQQQRTETDEIQRQVRIRDALKCPFCAVEVAHLGRHWRQAAACIALQKEFYQEERLSRHYIAAYASGTTEAVLFNQWKEERSKEPELNMFSVYAVRVDSTANGLLYVGSTNRSVRERIVEHICNTNKFARYTNIEYTTVATRLDETVARAMENAAILIFGPKHPTTANIAFNCNALAKRFDEDYVASCLVHHQAAVSYVVDAMKSGKWEQVAVDTPSTSRSCVKAGREPVRAQATRWEKNARTVRAKGWTAYKNEREKRKAAEARERDERQKRRALEKEVAELKSQLKMRKLSTIEEADESDENEPPPSPSSNAPSSHTPSITWPGGTPFSSP